MDNINCFLLIAVVLIYGCANHTVEEQSEESVKSYNEYNILGESEYNSSVELANNGDGDACHKLFVHYVYGLHQEENGLIWLRKGANLGHKQCIANLKFYKDKDITTTNSEAQAKD